MKLNFAGDIQSSKNVSKKSISTICKKSSEVELYELCSLFAWLISHQPAVLFSHNKPATSNQPIVLFSQNKTAPAISHQPTEQGPILCEMQFHV
jgi:hypothetical protein